ncbi:MAG: bifunctional proline dehydrogenase/L-glutamate gamma-semialdehyde dehydrogenase PutA, partial [Pseudomonadota bacterium]
IEAVVSDPSLAGWDGFGVVVQAYGQRAPYVIDWLHELATRLDRRLMVRLVKGAYWDTEVKLAQTEGLDGYPVYTRKLNTDVSYICCAQKLLGLTDRLYPQFATHNAHTVAAILELAEDTARFEFQRLHGMGESLHQRVLEKEGTRCRIYAPVGAHRDLLAYLVRRLLENGANSSFVNQIVDEAIPPEDVAADPFDALDALDGAVANPGIPLPARLYGPSRTNAAGFDLNDATTLAAIDAAREPFKTQHWHARPAIVGWAEGDHETVHVASPTRLDETVGSVVRCNDADVALAVSHACASAWATVPVAERAAALRRASDLFEAAFGEFFALLAREAGKTPLDCVGELREAVDFLRYYADEAERLGAGAAARGPIVCISPWNFPLAIFSGQIAAALAAGNPVLAKPAESTTLIAARAVALLHEAGVPADALQLLPGTGRAVGAALSAHPAVAGVCFTGSTQTAQHINRAMAASLAPSAPLIAETGGLNAMIVDSTALPEQAVRDIVASSFQSAGQRCSALRVLYLQADIADRVQAMLFGAMDELRLGDPWALSTDVGPVIDAAAKARIEAHIETARRQGRLLKQLDRVAPHRVALDRVASDRVATDAPADGHFVAPAVIGVGGIEDLGEEIFGPVLHIARFRSDEIDAVVDAINASGYGLTFGLHTRIDDRVQQVLGRVRVGNAYINRNQIGAIVGSQPFGGEGLSGTGPKAGGPHYVPRFTEEALVTLGAPDAGGPPVDTGTLQAALQHALAEVQTVNPEPVGAPLELPGPTGESNRLSRYPRGVVLCLGPGAVAAAEQVAAVRALGCAAVGVAPGLDAAVGFDGLVTPDQLTALEPVDGVVFHGDVTAARAVREALAARDGALVPLLQSADYAGRFLVERHVCIDTTAAGGNASLLAASAPVSAPVGAGHT